MEPKSKTVEIFNAAAELYGIARASPGITARQELAALLFIQLSKEKQAAVFGIIKNLRRTREETKK